MPAWGARDRKSGYWLATGCMVLKVCGLGPVEPRRRPAMQRQCFPARRRLGSCGVPVASIARRAFGNKRCSAARHFEYATGAREDTMSNAWENIQGRETRKTAVARSVRPLARSFTAPQANTSITAIMRPEKNKLTSYCTPGPAGQPLRNHRRSNHRRIRRSRR